MRNGQNGRRRGRSGTPRPQGGRSPEIGNRLEVRQRGNAHQLLEKYKSLARDATSQGDRINAEYYLQYADHYYRVLNENRPRQDEQQRGRPREWDGDDDDDREEGVGDFRTDTIAMTRETPPVVADPRPAPMVDEADDDEPRAPEAAAQADGGDEERPRRRRGRGRPRRTEGSDSEAGEFATVD